MTPKNLLLLAFSGIFLTHCVSSPHSMSDASRPIDPAGAGVIVATESTSLPSDMASADQLLPPPANEPYLPPPKAIWSNDSVAGVDTWRAMSEHMTFAPDATGPSIDLEMQKYRDHPRMVTAAAERASLYLPYVTRRLMESDFPPELALLPFLESAYDPHAISASGAAGLWQIQPRTGDVLGLKRNQWYDGRQDVVRSTDAVIGYFGHLHQVFDGDWLLALAAFNSGEGTVSRAIQRNIQQGKDTDFWALDLPEHTRSYVPRFLALARMFQNPEENQLRLSLLDRSRPLESVAVPKQISLALAAELAEVDYDTLKRLNTGLKRDITPPQGPYEILMPLNAAQRFETALVNASPASMSTAPMHSQPTPIDAAHIKVAAVKARTADYRVQAGDTLWDIARRFNVSPKALMRWNDIDEPQVLRPGQNLRVSDR